MSEDLLQDLAQYKSHKDKSRCLLVVFNTHLKKKKTPPHFDDDDDDEETCPVWFVDVVMSARGLIQLFRDLNPRMLHRKDRVRTGNHFSPNELK